MTQHRDDIDVILCETAEAYSAQVAEVAVGRAASRSALPVLITRRTRLLGFGSVPRTLTAEESRFGTPGAAVSACALEASYPASDRLCVAADEPICVSAAALLARMGGRRLVVCGRATWEDTLREVLEGQDASSVAVVAPAWGAGDLLDPSWLLSLLRVARASFRDQMNPTLGVITGADPGALTVLAAKAVLQSRIAERYASYPAAVFHQEDGSTPPPLPRWVDGEPQAPIFFVGQGEPRTAELTRRPWSAMLFTGHGRSYCACFGHLCSARQPEDDPAAETPSCVLGVECANADFGRVDPRMYDTPVMVLDVCGAGGLSSGLWDAGVPPLALLCAAAAPGAVISSDGITQNETVIEVVRALGTAETLGEATAQLNWCRRERNITLPYYLIGDPDAPAGPARWPAFAYEAPIERTTGGAAAVVRRRLLAPTHEAPFIRTRLPRSDDADSMPEAVFAWSSDGSTSVDAGWAFPEADSTDIWLAISGSPGAVADLRVEQRPVPDLPAGLLRKAEGAFERSSWWREPCSESVPELLSAAAAVLQTGKMLAGMSGSLLPGTPGDLRLSIASAINAWVSAQRACVERVLPLRARGLWPTTLWDVGVFSVDQSDAPCPHCGLYPTIRRRYRVGTTARREWWECRRCEVLLDRPLGDELPTVRLKAPEQLLPTDGGTATVEIDNAACSIDALGAGAVVVSHTGHGVRTEPEVFSVWTTAGENTNKEIALVLNEPPRVTHRYGLRAVLLLDGHWYWLSKPLLVLDEDRHAAAVWR